MQSCHRNHKSKMNTQKLGRSLSIAACTVKATSGRHHCRLAPGVDTLQLRPREPSWSTRRTLDVPTQSHSGCSTPALLNRRSGGLTARKTQRATSESRASKAERNALHEHALAHHATIIRRCARPDASRHGRHRYGAGQRPPRDAINADAETMIKFRSYIQLEFSFR